MDRKFYIGSTDVSAIAGVNKYQNALDVFNSKMGIYQKNQTQAMKMGLFLEDKVIELSEQELNIKVIKKQVFTIHKKHEFLAGTADGITECGSLLEVKTSRIGSDFLKDTVPENYLCQVQWLMGLNNLKKCYLCVLIAGQDFKTYTINFDEVLYNTLVQLAVNFWNNNILTCIPPKIEKELQKDLSQDVYTVYEEIKKTQKSIKEMEENLNTLKKQFDALIKDETEIKKDGELIAKKSLRKTETIDKKKLQEDIQDISKYIKKTEYFVTTFY